MIDLDDSKWQNAFVFVWIWSTLLSWSTGAVQYIGTWHRWVCSRNKYDISYQDNIELTNDTSFSKNRLSSFPTSFYNLFGSWHHQIQATTKMAVTKHCFYYDMQLNCTGFETDVQNLTDTISIDDTISVNDQTTYPGDQSQNWMYWSRRWPVIAYKLLYFTVVLYLL